MLAHTVNPIMGKVEGRLISRPACSAYRVLGQPELQGPRLKKPHKQTCFGVSIFTLLCYI